MKLFLCFVVFVTILIVISHSEQQEEVDQHLLQAAAEGILREVRRALQYGANLNARDNGGRTPLMLAVVNNRFDVVKDLVEKGADLLANTFEGDRSALLWAVYQGDLKIVQYLISKGVDVNEINRRGDTPLVVASYMGHVDMISYLVAEGADINHKTTSKLFSALHFASFRGKLAVVQSLLENNAEIDSKDSDGRTPLLLASLQGHVEVISYLIDHGADIHVRDNSGYTALLICVKMLQFECVDELIRQGAETSVRTKSGDNMITLAVKAESYEMVSLASIYEIESLEDSAIQKKALKHARKGKDPKVLAFLLQFIEPSL